LVTRGVWSGVWGERPRAANLGKHITGCGAAWLARLTGGQEVPGSNPGSPTKTKVQLKAGIPDSGAGLLFSLRVYCALTDRAARCCENDPDEMRAGWAEAEAAGGDQPTAAGSGAGLYAQSATEDSRRALAPAVCVRIGRDRRMALGPSISPGPLLRLAHPSASLPVRPRHLVSLNAVQGKAWAYRSIKTPATIRSGPAAFVPDP
jgi:hypothetical protein